MNHESISLETKLCVDLSGLCSGCGQLFAREIGRPEIYIADSESLCCYDCAAKTDQELGNFVYRPEQYVGPSRDLVCPECGGGGFGGSDGELSLHVGSQAWAFCRRHGYKWRVGSGLLLAPTTPIENQQKDCDYLSRFIEIQPLSVPRPPLTPVEPREPEFGSIIHQLELMRTLLHRPGSSKQLNETLNELTTDAVAKVTALLRLYCENFGLDALRARGVCTIPYQFLESDK